MDPLLSGGVLYVGYVLAFGLAGVICFGSLRGLDRIEDPDTRRGLSGLLVLTGGWAFAHVGYLVAPTEFLRYAFFLTGLVLGIAAIGPWLYFCSAYTGRSLHLHRPIRWSAIAVFGVIVFIKLTNPLHHRYFTTTVVTDPFNHLAIAHEPLHWLVMGLAYALAFVGIFMLLEVFVVVDSNANPLIVLVGLTGLPVAFDYVGATTPYLLDFTHSPLGVSAFAVGVLFLYVERFNTVRLARETDNPVILLDRDGRLRDWNQSAQALLPALETGRREPIGTVEPELAAAIEEPDQTVSIDRFGTRRYYQVTTNQFSTENTRLGRLITLTDVTDRERYRRKIERQNERLQEFASIVSHDLRNPLNVAMASLDRTITTGELDYLYDVETAHDRMETLIEDLLALAQSGRQIDEIESVELGDIAKKCWTVIDAGTATLDVSECQSLIIEADRKRLRQLLENLYRNAIEHGGEDVTISVGVLPDETGFYVEDDGTGIPPESLERLVEPGYSTREDGSGLGLTIVADVVRAHGWELVVTDSERGGARFEIRTSAIDTSTVGSNRHAVHPSTASSDEN